MTRIPKLVPLLHVKLSINRNINDVFDLYRALKGALAKDLDGQRGVTDVAPVEMGSDFKRWKPDTLHKTSAFIWHRSIKVTSRSTANSPHYNTLAEDFALDTGNWSYRLMLHAET